LQRRRMPTRCVSGRRQHCPPGNDSTLAGSIQSGWTRV
jgi:hypothetical protein